MPMQMKVMTGDLMVRVMMLEMMTGEESVMVM